MDFKLNDLRDLVTLRALQSFELLLDTMDYVPLSYLKKIQKHTFKLYRKQYRQAAKEARLPEPEPVSEPPPKPPESGKAVAVPLNS